MRMRWFAATAVLAALAVLVACNQRPAPHALAVDATGAVAADAAATVTVAEREAADGAVAVAPPRQPGQECGEDARRLYRVVACGGEGPLPAELAGLQAVVDEHCREVLPKLAAYRARYFETARKWFEARAPAALPARAVYAFSGGDLISALVAFPRATEITTVSLELAGDPRELSALTPAEVRRELAELR